MCKPCTKIYDCSGCKFFQENYVNKSLRKWCNRKHRPIADIIGEYSGCAESQDIEQPKQLYLNLKGTI